MAAHLHLLHRGAPKGAALVTLKSCDGEDSGHPHRPVTFVHQVELSTGQTVMSNCPACTVFEQLALRGALGGPDEGGCDG